MNFLLFPYFSPFLTLLIYFSNKPKAFWSNKYLSHKGAVLETQNVPGIGLYSSQSKLQLAMVLLKWKLYKSACSANLFYEINHISRNSQALEICSYCLNLRLKDAHFLKGKNYEQTLCLKR